MSRSNKKVLTPANTTWQNLSVLMLILQQLASAVMLRHEVTALVRAFTIQTKPFNLSNRNRRWQRLLQEVTSGLRLLHCLTQNQLLNRDVITSRRNFYPMLSQSILGLSVRKSQSNQLALAIITHKKLISLCDYEVQRLSLDSVNPPADLKAWLCWDRLALLARALTIHPESLATMPRLLQSVKRELKRLMMALVQVSIHLNSRMV